MKNRAISDNSDEALVHHILSHPHDIDEASRRLYDRYEPILLNYTTSKVHNRSDAEEIVQDTFHRAFKHLSKLKNGQWFRAWLFSIAKQWVANYYRRQSQERIKLIPIDGVYSERLEEAMLIAHQVNQQDAIHRAELESVWDSIDSLPKRQREAIRLRMQGVTYKEIATELETSVTIVHHLLYRAYQKLRKKAKQEVFLTTP